MDPIQVLKPKFHVEECLAYSCVLTVSLSIATVLYIIFFAVAPVVANYYEEPMFSPVLRVLGLTVFVQAFSATRTAVVNRNMQFKLLCYCHIAASVISGIVGIVCAYKGFGVWAIVVQRLMHNLLVTGLLFIMVKFRIKWQVSLERMKEILNFSAGVVSASLLYFVTNNLYSAVIGKRYSVTDLGYYSKGNQLPEQFSLYTFSAVSGVLLPTISSYQDDIERVKHIIRKVTAFSTYVIFPLMIGMMLTSEELIVLVCVYLRARNAGSKGQIICFVGVFDIGHRTGQCWEMQSHCDEYQLPKNNRYYRIPFRYIALLVLWCLRFGFT